MQTPRAAFFRRRVRGGLWEVRWDRRKQGVSRVGLGRASRARE